MIEPVASAIAVYRTSAWVWSRTIGRPVLWSDTTWASTTLYGGRIENTEKLLSTQCMPRSLFANTLNAVPEGGGAGATYVHDWERTGDPPVQPAGDEDVTVCVCVLLDWQLPHAEYVKDVQAVAGGTYVQERVRMGVPVQPRGDEENTVRACVLFDWHAPHALYVYVQAVAPSSAEALGTVTASALSSAAVRPILQFIY